MRYLWIVAALLTLAAPVLAQSNNPADNASFDRYTPGHYYKVTYDTTSWYTLMVQPVGHNWSVLAMDWRTVENDLRWREFILSRRPLQNRWGFGVAVDWWEGATERTEVTPFSYYDAGDVEFSVRFPLSDLDATSIGLRTALGDHNYAFATFSPECQPAFGLNWHNGRDQFDVAVQVDTWRTRTGHRIGDNWQLELRTVSCRDHHTVGLGVSFFN